MLQVSLNQFLKQMALLPSMGTKLNSMFKIVYRKSSLTKYIDGLEASHFIFKCDEATSERLSEYFCLMLLENDQYIFPYISI